jgi:AAA+ ATPase superfamily predicted ATPase
LRAMDRSYIFDLMNNPFSYGSISKRSSFTNRKEELSKIQSLCENSMNLVLISPRRWGKSSLIANLMEKNKSKKLIFCHLDMFNVTTEQEFYEQFLDAVLQATASKLEQWRQYAREFLSQITPSISVGSGPDTDFKLDFQLGKTEKSRKQILDIAQKIAEKQNIRIVVALDEFQNIDSFTNSLKFQKILRSVWQHHTLVSYIMYGSKRHLMAELFEKKEQPFYRFGEIMYLEKIDTQEWVNFLTRKFKQTQKTLSRPQARQVALSMQNHPFYVQQFAYILWDKTDKEVTEKLLAQTHHNLLIANEWRFINLYEPLTGKQRKTLVSLIEKGYEGITSKDTISRYKLGTSSTVIRSLEALQNAEIIERWGNKVHVLDPIFRLWLVERLQLQVNA